MGFGSFDSLCATSPLPLCFLLGPPSPLTSDNLPLLPTTCSARSIELANTIIFAAATDFAHILAMAMTSIMILHVRSKFTAVGRKEILTFFYIYLALTAVSLVLDAGVIEARNGGAFPWFVAVQNGLASALCVSLLVNGFVGFQLYEDGTTLSVWLLRISSLGIFVVSFAISLLTFKAWAGLSPTTTTGLFVVLYVVNGICVLVYIIMQVVLVVNTLQDRWPLGDLVFGVFFLVAGQVILYSFGERICEGANHYLDGMFFATVCNLLAVMMVYKYWDSITKEDLEFSVGTKMNNWELSAQKDSLLDDDHRRTSSMFDLAAAAGPLPGTRRSSLYDASSVHGQSMLDQAPPQQRPSSAGYAPSAWNRSHGQRRHSRNRSQGRSRSRSHSRGQSRDRYTEHSQHTQKEIESSGREQRLLEGSGREQQQQRRSLFGAAVEPDFYRSGDRRRASQGLVLDVLGNGNGDGTPRYAGERY